MEWVIENWFFILLAIMFITMHIFGHGCYGRHKGHEEHSDEGSSEKKGGYACH